MPRQVVDQRFGVRMRRLRTERGLSLRALAGRVLSSKSSLAEYETGKALPPRDLAKRIDEVLRADGELLASMSADERPTANQRVGWTWAGALDHALSNVEALLAAEDGTPGDQHVHLTGAGEIALTWLVAAHDASVARREGHRRVGESDVQRIRAVRRTLKTVDNAHGGGTALPAATAYLRREAKPLLRGRRSAPRWPDDVRHEPPRAAPRPCRVGCQPGPRWPGGHRTDR